MSAYQLVVFDWDGTLMDSMAKIVGCAKMSFEELGFPCPEDVQIRACIGLSLDDTWLRLCPTAKPDDMQAFVAVYRKHWLSWRGPESCLYDGVESVLAHLQEQDFYVAIATGKSRVGLDRDLDTTGIKHFFNASRCADEARSKPHPEMLEYLLDYFAVDGHQTLMVGDTEFDLQMAMGAKTHAVAVTYGAHDVERLEKSEPLALLDSIGGLVKWMGS